jgi:hypothetical protein
MIAEALAHERLEPFALRRARGDEVLDLEDPEDLAGDGRTDDVVGEA